MLLTNYHEFIPDDVCPASDEYQEWEVVFLNFEKALEEKWEEVEQAKQAKRDKKWEEYFDAQDEIKSTNNKDPQEASSWGEYVERGGADATDEVDEEQESWTNRQQSNLQRTY